MPARSANHAFCIPAYGHAHGLEACLASLSEQTRSGSELVIVTSTPNSHIESLASRYAARLELTGLTPDIARDWNRALHASSADLVTLAHQDDLYYPTYLEQVLKAFEEFPDSLIAFTRYAEHTPAGMRASNLNMWIKSALAELGFLGRRSIGNRTAKRRLLCLGNSICCPSVTFNRQALADFDFRTGFRTNLDWDAWTRLADRSGSFTYIREQLVSKGIHPASETSATIASKAREHEDRQMFQRFWSPPIAAMLMKFYRMSYASNKS